MIFSAEQHSAIARRLERRAEEEGLAPEQRADFSSRAELFRYLATAAADIAAGRRPKATMVHFQIMAAIRERFDDMPRYERRVAVAWYLRSARDLLEGAK
jgi:hypothetical protein